MKDGRRERPKHSSPLRTNFPSPFLEAVLSSRQCPLSSAVPRVGWLEEGWQPRSTAEKPQSWEAPPCHCTPVSAAVPCLEEFRPSVPQRGHCWPCHAQSSPLCSTAFRSNPDSEGLDSDLKGLWLPKWFSEKTHLCIGDLTLSPKDFTGSWIKCTAQKVSFTGEVLCSAVGWAPGSTGSLSGTGTARNQQHQLVHLPSQLSPGWAEWPPDYCAEKNRLFSDF